MKNRSPVKNLDHPVRAAYAGALPIRSG